MRRAEKEVVDRREIESIIRRATVCRLAMVDDGVPYIVPLNFGYADGVLYFHSAPAGRKIQILQRCGPVCFEIDGGHELVREATPCEWGMRYESVIGCGSVRFIDQPVQQREALACIMAQYATGEFSFPEHALDRTVVFVLHIESMTAKHSR